MNPASGAPAAPALSADGSSKPLRVALVTETYFPQVNGVSRTLDRLVRYLTGEGHEVLVLAPRYRDSTVLPVGAQLVAFPALPFPLYPEVSLCLVGKGGLREVLRRFSPHVVHVATEGPLGIAALGAARAQGLPVVSSFHTHFPRYLAFYRLGWLGPAAWRYLRWFHNRTTTTLCPTASVQETLLGRGFQEVAVWSRGVDADLFHPGRRDPDLRRRWGVRPEDVVLACVGRLAAEKNLPLLLEAFRLLPAELSCRLVLVGDGPLRPQLEQAPEVADGRVVLTGYHHGEALARAYASADLFAFPSLTETFGNVLLEAMASGLPAVAFAVPGPADVLRDGETGSLVPEMSARALADAIRDLVRTPERRAALAQNARRRAEAQSWNAVNAAALGAYRGALRRRDRLHSVV